jgi:Transposase and inactivated derivatives
MKARQVIEEILNRVFKWHRFPVSLKAEAVLFYFKGLSLRTVREFLWLAVDEKGLPVFMHLSRRRDAWTAKLVLYNAKAKGCTTDKGPWYVSAVKELAMEWLHEAFGKRNVVERWFFYIRHRIKRFYKRFPWNANHNSPKLLSFLCFLCYFLHPFSSRWEVQKLSFSPLPIV